MADTINTAKSPTDKLIALLSPLVAPLGYEIVHLEVHTHREKVLRLFIDHLEPTGQGAGPGIGIEDCVKVSRALDEPLDQMPDVDAAFHGAAYELEVSSPGVDRPLRTPRDYERFSGRDARIHVFRPLTAEELENSGYQQKNPKQKNFLGTLKGVRGEKVVLHVSPSMGLSKSSGKKGKGGKAEPETNSAEAVMIPLPLISKANLEPKFDEFDDKEGVEL